MIGTFLIIIGALLLAGYISKGVSGLITFRLPVLHCSIPQSLPPPVMASVELESTRPVSEAGVPSAASLLFADSPGSLAAEPRMSLVGTSGAGSERDWRSASEG